MLNYILLNIYYCNYCYSQYFWYFAAFKGLKGAGQQLAHKLARVPRKEKHRSYSQFL